MGRDPDPQAALHAHVAGHPIGIAAVVLTVGLGQGAQQQVSKQLAALGGNLLIVSPGSSTSGGVRGGFGSASTLTMADATALTSKTAAPDIGGVAPVLRRREQQLVQLVWSPKQTLP